MYSGVNAVTGESYRFESLPELVRQLGGWRWAVEYTAALEPTSRVVMVLRDTGPGQSVLEARVRIDVDQFARLMAGQWESGSPGGLGL